MPCTIVYAQETFPQSMRSSIFLAGPSPRSEAHFNWRISALEILEALGYDGHVFVPLPRDATFPNEYDVQASWEQDAMDRSDVVVFWVPRDLSITHTVAEGQSAERALKLPGFTTNVEFGFRARNRNVVLGCPNEASKCRYLEWLADRNFVTHVDSLEEVLRAAITMVGGGEYREGGECQVPLYLWRAKTFAQWLQAQKQAGNRLDGCKVELTFGVGPKKAFLLYWAAHVDVHVAQEGRNKSNEIVIGRPDIMHVVAYWPAPNLLDTEVVLVREFRSTASLGDCIVREVPGGSSAKNESPEIAAANELYEEVGFRPDPSRIRYVGRRQLAATTTSHHAHVYALELTDDERAALIAEAARGEVHGNPGETERTYVEMCTVRDLLHTPGVDWVNVGMVMATLGSKKC